ncbi:hypothetical protein NBRC116592_36010 [Colwellia sp. KU-HH00111]
MFNLLAIYEIGIYILLMFSVFMLDYGYKKGEIFIFGMWYCKGHGSKYYQVFFSYFGLIIFCLYMIYFEF